MASNNYPVSGSSAPQVAPYGSWASPVTSDVIVSETIGLDQIILDGSDTYWIEKRPAEQGRYVIVHRTPDGHTSDINPAPFNARNRVHEYGGGAAAVHAGIVYFSNYSDQRLYRVDTTMSGAQPVPVTPEGAWRYADGVVDSMRRRFICVREDHTDTSREAINTIVSVALDADSVEGNSGKILVGGNDFYSSPRVSPDGRQLAWMTWNHPNMPWDGCELWVARIAADGGLIDARHIAGERDESICQPTWSPSGVLHFVAENTGWWNLYRWNDALERVESLCPLDAEFGVPHWVFGQSTYAFAAPDRIICSYIQQGVEHLASLDTTTGTLTPISTPYSHYSSVQAIAERVVCHAGSPSAPPAIVQIDLATGELLTLQRASTVTLDSRYLSIAHPIAFPTEHGLTAHAFYYQPHNEDFSAPAGELPPVLVRSHGGPTHVTDDSFDLDIQYWTSRGFAVLDVNYGGSTGYGRDYRQRLDGQWGVVDVDDCVNGARYLVAQDLVDGNRLTIDGGSAGGYTTLCALTFRHVFKAGASHFGISDLVPFIQDTHKFESRYCDRLIGPPQNIELYRQRSPINFLDSISCPIIFFQGLEDKVVPPNQAEMMVDALRRKGLPVAYIAFEGEQHGFRRAPNIRRSMDGELYFYARIFGFSLAEDIEPVEIENL